MKTNVKPGMLAYIVQDRQRTIVTPGVIGRVVFVERLYEPGAIFQHVDGRRLQSDNSHSSLAWVVSAKEPMPLMIVGGVYAGEVWQTYERPMLDTCLRPLNDPDLGITDEEVRELYSTKEKEVV